VIAAWVLAAPLLIVTLALVLLLVVGVASIADYNATGWMGPVLAIGTAITAKIVPLSRGLLVGTFLVRIFLVPSIALLLGSRAL
jgi:hypothetical protein